MSEITCPAGQRIAAAPDGQRACRCPIEENTLSAVTDPRSLVGYCEGDYTQCSTWRSEKERVWARRRQHRLPEETFFTKE